jgi:probable dihydroxyacetone kinase regulator
LADSITTKKTLAAALKDLAFTEPFSKISIGDICKRCEMSRKTFYYHFKDKEDLVNWIFEAEFVQRARERQYDTVWHALEDLLGYFYRHHAFYRKVLQQEGRNSFSAYFGELIHSVFVEQLKMIAGDSAASEIQVDFVADGMVCMLKRWLAQPDCLTPEELIAELKTGADVMARYIAESLRAEN